MRPLVPESFRIFAILQCRRAGSCLAFSRFLPPRLRRDTFRPARRNDRSDRFSGRRAATDSGLTADSRESRQTWINANLPDTASYTVL